MGVDYMEAHSRGICCMRKHENYLISGDLEGKIQIRDINEGYKMVTEVQT